MWDLLEEAKKLISIPSLTTEGNREVAEFLAPFARRAGLNVTFQGPSDGLGQREVNLIASTLDLDSRDLCPEGLLFVTHLDTVPPGDPSLWTETGGDPFCATIRGDRIYGLGSADTKLDFLCKLKAIETVGVGNLKIPFCLVGTYGEERALSGIRRFMESGLVHPRLALVGEPSELRPVLSHKGILYMRVVHKLPHPALRKAPGHPLPPGEREIGEKIFLGRAAHGSTPHLGENAIEKAMKWLFEEQEKRPNLELLGIQGGTVHNIVPERCLVQVSEGRGLSQRIKFLKGFWGLVQIVDGQISLKKNPKFDPPVTTRNIGVVHGKDDRIEIEFDYRLIPESDGNEIFEVFRGLSRERGASVEVVYSNPPMDTSEDATITRHILKALNQVGLPPEYHFKSGNTEGAIVNQRGAETVVIGPGKSTGNIHRPNEYNEISQLHKAVEFYTAFLREFCK